MATITKIKGRKGVRWRCQVRRAGLGGSMAETFATKTEAAEWGRLQEGKLDGGQDPSAGKGWTVSKAIEHFKSLRASAKRPVTGSQLSFLRNLDAFLGPVEIIKLSYRWLRLFCESRVHPVEGKGVKPGSARQEVAILGTVLRTVAADLGTTFPDVVHRGTLSLLRDNGLIGSDEQRERRPEGDELDRVMAHLPVEYHAATMFAIISAMRCGEICRIARSDIDHDQQAIKLWRKYKRGRRLCVVPLIEGAYEFLMRVPRIAGEDRLFSIESSRWDIAWRRACKRAGVANLRRHDLRHDGISRLFERGWDIPEVAAVSGHLTWTQLRRYTNLRPQDFKHGPAKVRALRLVS